MGIFPRLALSPHLSFRSFTYLFHLSLSLSLFAVSLAESHSTSIPFPSNVPPTRSSNSIVLAEVAVTRDGDQANRGSWLRRISSLVPHPLAPLPPFPFIWRTVYIFHRLEILFARSAAKLSRFEIFMNGSLREGLTHGPSGGRTKRISGRITRRASENARRVPAICRCCQIPGRDVATSPSQKSIHPTCVWLPLAKDH